MDIEDAQQLNRQLQINIMKQLREYEEQTGLRITKAEMVDYQDTRFFSTHVFMPPKHMKKDNV